ncbi:MAG: hypothetical protein O2819_05415 [Planctomycetota bacterium]|nr:hypothetical protein [Planctomycetota bacterium]MDA1106374.1 hypothetical protein [Planctomycetota bacterium]
MRRRSVDPDPVVQPDDIPQLAYQFMRSNLTGHIAFDGDRRTIKVTPLPDGRLVAPVMVAMLRSTDVVIELPDDGDDNLQLTVTLEPLDPHGGEGFACDRWRIYHGDPPDVRWALATIDAGRYRGWFIDGPTLARENPLAGCELAICRDANLEVATLKRAIHKVIGSDPPSALLVGVDPWGFDVRRHVDVVRLRLKEGTIVTDERSAMAALQDLAD